MEIKRWDLNDSVFGYWIQYLLFNKFKHFLEDIKIFELLFDIYQNRFLQSAGLLKTYCPKVTFTFTDKNFITEDNK